MNDWRVWSLQNHRSWDRETMDSKQGPLLERSPAKSISAN